MRKYIEFLEADIEGLRSVTSGDNSLKDTTFILDPSSEGKIETSETTTSINLVTMTRVGFAKRTYRHYHIRQRRGGMGIFYLEASEDDPPTLLALADEKQQLLLITNQARTFRIPVDQIIETPVRARGAAINSKLSMQPGEYPASLLPDHTD
jgi:DNA gyrase/topoisomerase IV subunit A